MAVYIIALVRDGELRAGKIKKPLITYVRSANPVGLELHVLDAIV